MKKMNFYLGAILCVALLWAASPPVLASSAAVEQLLSKARTLEGRGRLDLAALAWEQTLLADPSNTEALVGLAKFAKQNGKTEEANRYLQQVRKVDPKNPAIGQVEGMTSAGKQRSGIEEAGRLAAAQNFEGAMRIYRGLFGDDPPPGGLAISYYETQAATPGGWEVAVKNIERLAAKYPQSEEYRLSLGRLKTYRPLSRVEGMQILAGVKGDALLVNKARAAWRQALVWSAGGANSMPSLQAYLDRYPDPELAKLMAHPPYKTEPAAAQLRPSAPPESLEAGAGYSSLKEGKLNDAEKHFQSALKATPRGASAFAGLGFLRMKQEDFHAAAGFFEQALALQPKDKSTADALAAARFWEQMKAGGTALNQNDSATALASFQAALALRPASLQAAESIAGAYMQQRKPALAVPFYEKLVQAKPQSLDYQYGLVQAQYQAGAAAQALATLKRAPPQIKEQWSKNPDHLALLSFIYADAGDLDQSKRMFQNAVAAAGSNKTELPTGLQLEFAGLLLRLGNSRQAADAFQSIAAKHPSNVEAWVGSIDALLQIPDSARAYEVLQKMPQAAYSLAAGKSDFLRSVARLQASLKRYDLAEKSLNAAAALDAAQDRRPDVEGRLQLADLYIQRQQPSLAEPLLSSVVEEYPNNKRAWVSLITLLHAAKSDQSAFSLIQKIPQPLSAELQTDAGFVALEASVYGAAGHKDEALSMLRLARRDYESRRASVPAGIEIQLAWLLFNGAGSQSELYQVLEHTGARPGLSSSERADLDQIWSLWCQRRAQSAIEANDLPKAISILQAAVLLLPRDIRIQAQLASTYLTAQDFPKAFEIYQRWDLKGATADDFRGALGTASALHKDAIATQWLERALREYPADSRLLRLAGQQAAQQGEYKLAGIYLHQALQHLPPEGTPPLDEKMEFLSPGQQPREVERTLRHLLLSTATEPGKADAYSNTPYAAFPAPPEPEPAPSRAAFDTAPNPLFDVLVVPVQATISRPGPNQNAFSQSVLDPSRDDTPAPTPVPTPAPNYGRAFAPGSDAIPESPTRDSTEPLDPSPLSVAAIRKPVPEVDLKQQIQGDIEAVEGRNTPFLQNGINLHGRTGQGGFDKLLVEEADIEASVTVSDRVRLSLIAKPTYLDSGSPSGDSLLGFGTTATKGAPGSRTAYGVAGEFQLASRDFGLRLGITPEEFLVHSWLGGLRWNPAKGPFTIVLDRDSVRDTKLSYAGERDPSSQRVWGGVMANGASLIGNWSQGNTGFYAKVGYQDLEGKTVAKNTRIDANVGSYFKVYSHKAGDLTVGLNLSGMHYDKNLRYFTLGQGGYFSPQQYILFNVPVRWVGNWNRQLQYSIAASLGVQHFSEESSAYFPTDAIRQALSGLAYPASTNTGGNYNLSFQTIYQITPQWLGGAFFDVNNARQYRSVNAGLYLKYLFKPRPMSPDLNLRAIPDWTGASPFALP